ncbi:MAG: hypothetical protein EBT03_08420, partial [Betaproteobacteria bacterium]|nr:hypothetical protein [Betaproteobacteria bacterium]
MATFRFGRDVNMKWQGNDIQGPAGTIFRISDAYYEEFNSQVGQVEPTLEWLVTNELAAVQSQVAGLPVSATLPITATTSTAGTNISFAVGTAPAGYVLTSNGSGSAAFAAAAAATPATVVQGTSPISVSTSSNTATVSLSANYQTAGTYVTSVSGTSPITVSGTTAITVSIDPTLTTANSAEIIRQYVKNDSGVALTKGQPVYITGANGTNVLIGLSAASAEATSSKTLGLLEQNLAINGLGYVITEGRLTNIDTSTATAGQSVWLGASAGSKTYGAPPAEPNHGVYLGVVTKANASTGEIFVKVQNGYELDELHDVSAASPSDGDIIQYKTSSSLWTNSSITNAGIATSGHSHSGLLPTGGTTGQVLSKVSGTNYDVTWSAATGGASLSNTAAIALSTTASAGTATDASRQDHVHPTTGINKVYYQTTTPTGGSYTTGDLWIDSDATLGGPITLIDSTSSTSTTTAATPKNVKTTYD